MKRYLERRANVTTKPQLKGSRGMVAMQIQVEKVRRKKTGIEPSRPQGGVSERAC